MFCYKIHEAFNDTILAIADDDIIGKNFEEGELTLFISADFYQQDKCDEKEIESLIKRATIINASGKKIISFLTEKKLINEDSVITIQGIPHAQVVVV